MRLAAAIVIGLALSATARAEHGIPSAQALDDMGLSGMRIMSDHEALAVRGTGFVKVGSPLFDQFTAFHQEITDFRTTVAAFQATAGNHPSQAEPWYRQGKISFHHSVAVFYAKIHP